jgi:hypothetical protein
LRVETIDAANTGALERACSRLWNVDYGDGTARGAQEAVNHVVCVQVYSGYFPTIAPSELMANPCVP